MKLTATAITCAMIVLTLLAPALAIEIKGNTLTLSKEEQAVCDAGGGCVVIPAYALGAAFLKLRSETQEQAFEAGAHAGYTAGYTAGLKAAGNKL